jgi:hypothetical protein
MPSRERILDVAVLYEDGCPTTAGTVKLLEQCAAEAGVRIALRREKVASQDDADRTRFLGSPTVQIEGRDIDPSVRECYVFGFV